MFVAVDLEYDSFKEDSHIVEIKVFPSKTKEELEKEFEAITPGVYVFECHSEAGWGGGRISWRESIFNGDYSKLGANRINIRDLSRAQQVSGKPFGRYYSRVDVKEFSMKKIKEIRPKHYQRDFLYFCFNHPAAEETEFAS